MAEPGLAQDGYEIVRGILPPGLRAELIAAVERVQGSVAELPPSLLDRLTFERDLPENRRDGVPAAAVGDAIFILGDAVRFDPAFRAVLRLPALVAALRRALGGAAPVAHFLNVTIKHPRFGRAIGWHRDFPNRYACPGNSRFVRAMLCLDGMSAESGATAFLPGSHHLTDAAARALFAAGQRIAAPEQGVRLAACAPGDLVLIHPKVLHGGGGNRSDRPRRNIILQAGDAAAPLLHMPAEEEVAGCLLDGG